jgi:hypothetical protein
MCDGFTAFFSNPARIALVIGTFALRRAAVASAGNLSSDEREDRFNRWVIPALGILGLLAGYVPA